MNDDYDRVLLSSVAKLLDWNNDRLYSYVTNNAPLAGKDRMRVGTNPLYRANTPGRTEAVG